MKFWTLVRTKWNRFRCFWHNRRLLIVWAIQLADELARYDIEIPDADHIQDSLNKLESRIQAAEAAEAMSDLFRASTGPFQRRLASDYGVVPDTGIDYEPQG